MSTPKKLNLSAQILKSGKSPLHLAQDTATPPLPVSEMAMVLTLDELSPNPDNPRTSRNPRYDEIKRSIRHRGLDSVPKVTRDPEGDGSYIISDGGNTRYAILTELWQETGEERFYRIHTIVKPWPGRLKCLVGHLAEGELHSDLSFIEKVLGVHNARTIQEQHLGRPVSHRELAELLNQEGYPIHNSTISRMDEVRRHLYPHLKALLDSGMSRNQALPLLGLRSAAEKVWSKFQLITGDADTSFEAVFGRTCLPFNHPDSYSLEMFRDEFIGELVKALPHSELNYDRWLIELDPKEQQRRALFGDPPPAPDIPPPASSVPGIPAPEESQTVTTQLPPDTTQFTPTTSLRSGTLTGDQVKPEPESSVTPAAANEEKHTPSQEEQLDLYGGMSVFSGDAPASNGALLSAFDDAASTTEGEHRTSSVSFAEQGLEPVADIWRISTLQDDIEHLQAMAYRLAFELAEAMDCAQTVSEAKDATEAGFHVRPVENNVFSDFLAGLAGDETRDIPFNFYAFSLHVVGFPQPGQTPVLQDIHVVKMLRLIRVLRRLRELQRGAPKTGGADE